MIMRHHYLTKFTGAYFLATDDQRDFDLLAGNIIQRGFQQSTLRRTGFVVVDWLVYRHRNFKDSIIEQIHDVYLSRR